VLRGVQDKGEFTFYTMYHQMSSREVCGLWWFFTWRKKIHIFILSFCEKVATGVVMLLLGIAAHFM